MTLMANAQQRGWGDPDAKGYRQRHIVTITAGGVKLHIRSEVAHLFKGFLDELVATGYRLDVDADDWGYNNRDIRGRPGVKSNHAWGLAIDINALKNPMTEAHPGHAGQPGHDHRGVHTDMPRNTGALASKYGLKWGANYSGRKDAMHFEFEGRPSDVARYPDPTQRPQEPPMTKEEHDWLKAVHERVVGEGPVLANTNAQVNALRIMAQEIKDAVADIDTGGGPGQISDADVDRIVDATIKEIAS